jgi:hypothetical protein
MMIEVEVISEEQAVLGIILYSAMTCADSLSFPLWAAPALVGLLGLNIDLAMDAVAIRLDMWHWLGYAGNQEWFGVPYVNFYAWFIVLCSCSALLWRVRSLTMRPGWRRPLAGRAAWLRGDPLQRDAGIAPTTLPSTRAGERSACPSWM